MSSIDKDLQTIKTAKRVLGVVVAIEAAILIAFFLGPIILVLIPRSWVFAINDEQMNKALIFAGNQIAPFVLYYLLFVVLRSLIAIIEELKSTV